MSDFGYEYTIESNSYPYSDICQSCWSVPCKCSGVPGSYFFAAIYTCKYCGQVEHGELTQCPRIKDIVYFADGSIRRILFYSPKDMK